MPRVTGIGRYTLELIKALSKIDASNEYVVLVNEDSDISQWLDVKRVRVAVSEARPLSLKEHIVIGVYRIIYALSGQFPRPFFQHVADGFFLIVYRDDDGEFVLRR